MDERTEARLEKQRNLQIAMANEVIDTMRIGLSAQQQNILDFMLKEIKATDMPNKRYSITIQDFCLANNIVYMRGSTNYKDIKKGIQALNGVSKWIANEERHEEVLVQWFKNVVIKTDSGTIEYSIDDTMYPYLFGLLKTKHYTSYYYRDIGSFDSKYSKYLFRILERYIGVDITEPFIEVSKLKSLMDAEKYKNFKDFRVCVLDVAVNEINRTTFLKVSYDPHKKVGSRAYTHIVFHLEKVKYTDEEWLPRNNANLDKFGEDIL